MNSSKTIIKHLNDFLDYCEIEKGLRDNTQENYKKYLEKFFFWLNSTQNSFLLPHQLTPDHIWTYRLYLSITPSPATGKLLTKGTQNYYLIALRALLSYFVAKDILSLPPSKISLPKSYRSAKSTIYPNLEMVDAILAGPKGMDCISLRDRALLHTIISTGLKVKQVSDLNLDSVKDLPQNVKVYIEDYLKTRQNDKEQSLFINYGGRKDATKRLTPRSIERIVKSYSTAIGFNSSITPELLRFANILSMWNKEIDIKGLGWGEGECKINKEFVWLKRDISVMPERYRSHEPLQSLVTCDNCILRKIAILIVAGLIKAQKQAIKDAWPNFNFDNTERRLHQHGADWHQKMIDSVAQYFTKHGHQNNIIMEPILNYGRADLGIKSENKNIYIEVGTVSLLKVWYNLMVMPNSIFILLPDEKFIIKFEN